MSKSYLDYSGLIYLFSKIKATLAALTVDWSRVTGKPTIPEEMVVLSYGSSTWQDFIDAYNDHRVVYCRASSNSNPATGSQTRMAFMAYVNNAETPSNVEFQYYRSVSSHSENQQGDQVYIYKLDSSKGGTWTVTVREAYTKILAGTNMTSSYSGGKLTLNASGGGAEQIQSDWNQSDNTAKDFIKNRPSIPAAQVNADWNASSGVAQILNKPTIPAAQIQSDWNQSDNTAKDFIKNKPTIPVVTPQEQADWNESDTESPAYIQNKPTIPAAQIQSDWNQSDNSAKDFIKNKPTLFSGDYNDLDNKPTIPAAQIQSDWNQSDNSAKDFIRNKPTIPAAQIQSDWNQSDNTQKDFIKNKPTIPTLPSNIVTGTSQSYTIWTGTQAQYDALNSYSSNTLYFIKEA